MRLYVRVPVNWSLVGLLLTTLALLAFMLILVGSCTPSRAETFGSWDRQGRKVESVICSRYSCSVYDARTGRVVRKIRRTS
jgi:hypothetical protein